MTTGVIFSNLPLKHNFSGIITQAVALSHVYFNSAHGLTWLSQSYAKGPLYAESE